MNSRINSFNVFDVIVARNEKYRMAGIVADVDETMNELLIDFKGEFVANCDWQHSVCWLCRW